MTYFYKDWVDENWQSPKFCNSLKKCATIEE